MRRILDDSGPSEVWQFYCIPHGEENVLWLNVSMHDLVFMQKFNSLTNLLNVVGILSVTQLTDAMVILKVFYQVVEITVSAVFENHVEFWTLIKHTPKFCNILMFIQRHYLNFLNQVFYQVRIDDLLLLYDFDGTYHSCLLVNGLVNFWVSPLSNRFREESKMLGS